MASEAADKVGDRGAGTRVRRIRPDEIDWICGMDWSPLVKERDTFYLLALAMHGRWSLVAEVGGKPAGLVLACADDSQTRLYVNHLLVGTAYRGTGVGTALMDRLEHEARDAGIRRVWLLTIDAKGFYERRGYRVSADALPEALQAFVVRVKRSFVMIKDL